MIDSLFNNGGIWFSVPAILGTVYFLFQIFMGGIGEDLDVDAASGTGDTPGAEIGVLSLQTLSAFFMGSGWSGFAALRLLDLGLTGAVVIAVVSGIAFAWMLIWLMRRMMRLQNSGNVRLADAVGMVGDVYIQVPASGRGQGRVTLVLGTRQREFDAVQTGADPIGSNVRVRVTHADEATNTLTVERVS